MPTGVYTRKKEQREAISIRMKKMWDNNDKGKKEFIKRIVEAYKEEKKNK